MKQPNEYTDEELLRHYNQCSHEVWVDFHPVPCPVCEEYEKRNLEPEPSCVCEGNWRHIVTRSEPLIGKWYLDDHNVSWRFQGVLWAEDDFYYLFRGMPDVHGVRHKYLTCCASIEQHGMRLIHE